MLKGVRMYLGKSQASKIILTLAILIFSAGTVSANFEPIFEPKLEIDRTEGKISIDGSLDDPGWKDAEWVDDFVERHPGDNTKPIVSTKAFITYDKDHLYVAFVCLDDPNNIRATMCQRDQFSGDDAVLFLLDTYGDANWAYEFYVNPYGVQKDLLWTNIAGEDQGYDLIWESAAQITDSGYQVELAIPFASIRFPNNDVQSWKVDFWRTHPRESYRQFSWAAYDRNEQCWPCQWGTVEGITDVKPGKGFEILPTMIANRADQLNFNNSSSSDVPFNNGNIDGEFSIGTKYSINSNVTLEATFNPDFSQVESDATQIDVNSTVALFYPERRPFFQEGRDIFRTLFNSFYTRTINDPQFAMKLVGRTDLYRFGILSAVDDNTYYLIPGEESTLWLGNVGKSYVNVFRAMRSFGNSTQIGFILNDRRFEAGGYNTVAALDKRIRLSKNYSIDGQYIATFTEEPNKPSLTPGYEAIEFDDGKYNASFDGEKFTGFGFISRLNRNGRHWNMMLNFNQVDHSYRTETGYDPWVNYRSLAMWNGYNFYFDNNSIFERITPQVYIENRWNFEGDHKWTHVNAALENNLRWAQTHIGLSYNNGTELWYGDQFNDLWRVGFNLNSRPHASIGMALRVNYGADVYLTYPAQKGKQTGIFASLNLKPTDRLIIEPNLNFQKMVNYSTGEEFYSGFVTRTRIRFQASKAISLRLVVEHDNFGHRWNIDPLITYKLNPFTVFYIGSSQSVVNYGNSDFDNRFYKYIEDPDDPDILIRERIHPDFNRDWSLENRQFFLKLQYLFQT